MLILKHLKQLFTRNFAFIVYALFRANIRSRDYNSVLGWVWGLLAPLLSLAITYTIFSRHFSGQMKSYALYLFIGLVTTNFFTVGTTYALDTFKRSRDLALNSLIPRESLVLAELLVHLKKYLIEITICIFFSVYLGLFNLPAFLLILVLVFSLFLLILGAGCVLLLMNSFISDIAHVWSLAARLFFFITPVFYTLDDIGPWAAKVVYWLNPLTPIIIAIRECLINAGSIEISVIVHAILIGIISFIVGYGLFVKYQDLLVERI